MKYQKIILVILLPLHLGCSVAKLQEKGKVKPKYFYSKFAFETYQSAVVFDAIVDGQTKKFLFNNTSDFSFVQREILQRKKSKPPKASTGKIKSGRVVVPSIQIGNTQFLKTHALKGDSAEYKAQVPDFGGIIGKPIISKANWLINCSEKRMEISNANLVGESFKEIETVWKNGVPYTSIDINGKQYQVLLDLGSPSALSLPKGSEFAEDVARAIGLSESTLNSHTQRGLQKPKEKVLVIPKVRLGEFEFKQVDVNISTSGEPGIGLNFFRDYLIYIDNLNGGVYKLKKNDPKR